MSQKIVVIEDEPEFLQLMEGWLSHAGYKVATANNGEDGLEKIKSFRPDLIILDALVPGMTGVELVEEIQRQTENISKIPIIMMSGRESMRDLSGEIFAFIAKPFTLIEMAEKIKEALKTSCPKP